MNDVEILDCIGNTKSGVIDLSQGHLFMCKECLIHANSEKSISSINSFAANTNFTFNLPDRV